MKPEHFLLLKRELAAVRTRIEQLRDAVQDQAKTIDAAREVQQANKAAPLIVTYNDQTVRDTKDENDRQYRIQCSLRNWTAGAVLAAVAYAAIAAFTWWQAITQNKISRYALVAVNRSFVEIANKDGPQDFDLQYMGLDDLKGQLAFNVWMENAGNSTAVRMRYEIVVEVRDAAQAPSFNYSQAHRTGTAGPLYRGKDRPVSVFVPVDGRNEPMRLTPQLREDLIQGNKYIAIFGYIAYEDNFGLWRKDFCMWKTFHNGLPIKHFNANSCIANNKQSGKEKTDWP